MVQCHKLKLLSGWDWLCQPTLMVVTLGSVWLLKDRFDGSGLDWLGHRSRPRNLYASGKSKLQTARPFLVICFGRVKCEGDCSVVTREFRQVILCCNTVDIFAGIPILGPRETLRFNLNAQERVARR